MKNILFVGIGQVGCEIADSYARLTNKKNNIGVVAIDTDERTFADINDADTISMAFQCDISDALEVINSDYITSWFPQRVGDEQVRYFETLPLNTGANLWRAKALLSFYYYLFTKKSNDSQFFELEKILERFDKDAEIEIHFAASLAGGTGSGLLLPLALYLKRYLKEHTNQRIGAKAFLALPEITEELLTKDQLTKARANTYAFLQELNAINSVAEGDDTLSFCIGHPDDDVLGILFDSADPKFQTPDQKPFEEVYLFRRMPGFRSVALHTKFIADSAEILLTNTIESLGNGTLKSKIPNDIYGGISVAKTVYPLDSIVNYISHAYVSDLADQQWLTLFRDTSALLPNSTKADINGGPSKKNTEDIVRTVIATVDEYFDENESYSPILGRKYPSPEKDSSPLSIASRDYIELLKNEISKEFSTNGIERIFEFIKQYNKAVAEEEKQEKKCLFQRKKRYPELAADALEMCGNLISYYKNGIRALENPSTTVSMIDNPISNLSLIEKVLKENGRYLHPSYALAKLAKLYDTLSKSVSRFRKENPTLEEELPEEQIAIPEHLIKIDHHTYTNSSYSDKGGEKRFKRVIYGDNEHIGKKNDDKLLFVYDLEMTANRIHEMFLISRIEQILPLLENWIHYYYCFFTELKNSIQLLNEATVFALHSNAFSAGMYHYIGASVIEKKNLHSRFSDSIKEDLYYDFENRFDASLGELAYNFVAKNTEPKDTLEERVEIELPTEFVPKSDIPEITGTLFGFVEHIREKCVQTDFYKDAIDKNVFEILLSQSIERGGEDQKLAISKTFLTELVPFLHTFPRDCDTHNILKNMVQNVLVILPESVYNFLQSNAEQFGNRSPENVIKELMMDAGEYDGRVYFDSAIDEKEICIARKSNCFGLYLLEYANEESDLPIYYKAYQNALKKKEFLSTDMWNPNIICASSPEALPRIYNKNNLI